MFDKRCDNTFFLVTFYLSCGSILIRCEQRGRIHKLDLFYLLGLGIFYYVLEIGLNMVLLFHIFCGKVGCIMVGLCPFFFVFYVDAMAANLENLIEKSIAGMKFDCLSIERLSDGLLRVVIDRCSDHPEAHRGVTIDDCELCSRHLQYVFSVEGVEYRRLEISSPGLDRPLRTRSDFERFIGAPVFIQMKLPVDRYFGRKNFRGVLISIVDGVVTLQLDEIVQYFPSRNRIKSRFRNKAYANNENKYPMIGQEGNALKTKIELNFSEIRSACLIPQIDFRKRKK